MPEQAPMTQAQIDALLRQVQENQASGAMPAAPIQPPAVPLPSIAPEAAPAAPAEGGIMKLLSGLFSGLLGGTSAAELSNGAAMAPATPQALQEQRRRAAALGGQAPPQ